MASYCAKCGAEVPSDKQSCTACGAPLAAFAPVATFSPVSAYPQPVAPPVKSGTSAVKIILIIVAVFVGLGILGAGAFGFFVWRIAHAVHVSGSGDQATVSLPGGTITANSSENFSASELGTDIYPGAKSGKGSMRMNLPNASMITAVYDTADSKEQVLNFYKSKLGGGASVIDTQDGAILTLTKGEEESVMVTISSKSSENDGKTRISILHTKKSRSS
jgi:zinc-ribbon domain